MAGKNLRSRKNLSQNNPINNINNNNNNNKTTTKHNKLNDDELIIMTKAQLKIECRKRGQKTTGNKIELLQRLGYKMSNNIKNREINNKTLNGNNLINNIKNENEDEHKRKLKLERLERQSIVLWRKPLTTIQYSTKEVFTLLTIYGQKILNYRKTVSLLLISLLCLYLSLNTSGPHQTFLGNIYKQLLWCSYWIGLGILSSVGLGTGLHTFILYLGPHIAQVTLAAYECESLNFPQPPYPDEVICPDERNPTSITILSIMSKVRLEAMCWGAGTALGELPPYFMAKAARLSGIDPDDEDDELQEFEELQRKQNNKNQLTFIERTKLYMENLVKKVGFLGILACASIPNPLFDLAGITCGHFMVPFWTFFGATLIGKAIIKMHIQKLFVIIAFNENLIELAIDKLNLIPIIGNKLQIPVKDYLNGQKLKLHKNAINNNSNKIDSKNFLSLLFEIFVFLMIFYFIISIINSFAQNYHKRLHKGKHHNKIAKD